MTPSRKVFPFAGIAFAAASLFLSGCSGESAVDHQRAAALEEQSEALEDASISARVASTLLEDGSLKDTEIHVETYNHVVRLYGFVHSRAEADLAERITLTVAHVDHVKNVLVVE